MCAMLQYRFLINLFLLLRSQIKHCDDLGIPADKSSTLFTFIGIFATIGRLCAGCLCDLKYVNSRLLYQASVLLSSASIMLLTVAKTYTPLAAVVIIFSLGDGLVVSTYVIELFKSVKESERALCLGFCMMAGGALIFCGPPLAGKMSRTLLFFPPFKLSRS